MKFNENPIGIRRQCSGDYQEIHWKSIGNHFGNPSKIQWKSLDVSKDPKEIRGEFIGNPSGNPLDIHLESEWNPNELLRKAFGNYFETHCKSMEIAMKSEGDPFKIMW